MCKGRVMREQGEEGSNTSVQVVARLSALS